MTKMQILKIIRLISKLVKGIKYIFLDARNCALYLLLK